MGVSVKEFFEHKNSFVKYRTSVYEISPQTIKSNMIDINLYEKFLKRKKHNKITGPSVMEFQKHLKLDRNNCGRSINRKIFTLRSYSNFLMVSEVKGAKQLPFNDVLKARQGYGNRPDALTHGNVKKVFNAINRTSCLGIRNYAIYALMYLCGLRVGEVYNLDLDDLDFINKKLHVTGKGKKKRTLYIKKELLKILTEYITVRSNFYNSRNTDALFVSKKGNRLAIRTMEDNFKKIVFIAELKVKVKFNVTCHTLRHTFASHLNDKGTDMLVIQSLMGHTSSKSTEPYIHPSYDRIMEALEKLPSVIFMNKLIEGGEINFQKIKRE